MNPFMKIFLPACVIVVALSCGWIYVNSQKQEPVSLGEPRITTDYILPSDSPEFVGLVSAKLQKNNLERLSTAEKSNLDTVVAAMITKAVLPDSSTLDRLAQDGKVTSSTLLDNSVTETLTLSGWERGLELIKSNPRVGKKAVEMNRVSLGKSKLTYINTALIKSEPDANANDIAHDLAYAKKRILEWGFDSLRHKLMTLEIAVSSPEGKAVVLIYFIVTTDGKIVPVPMFRIVDE